MNMKKLGMGVGFVSTMVFCGASQPIPVNDAHNGGVPIDMQAVGTNHLFTVLKQMKDKQNLVFSRIDELDHNLQHVSQEALKPMSDMVAELQQLIAHGTAKLHAVEAQLNALSGTTVSQDSLATTVSLLEQRLKKAEDYIATLENIAKDLLNPS